MTEHDDPNEVTESTVDGDEPEYDPAELPGPEVDEAEVDEGEGADTGADGDDPGEAEPDDPYARD